MSTLADGSDEDTAVASAPPTAQEIEGLVRQQNARRFNQRRKHLHTVSIWTDSRYFTGLNLDSYNFAELIFHDTVFNGCSFCFTDFSGADLTKATFKECYLDGANFTSATLQKARFIRCDLGRANFADAEKMPWRLRLKVLWHLWQSWR